MENGMDIWWFLFWKTSIIIIVLMITWYCPHIELKITQVVPWVIIAVIRTCIRAHSIQRLEQMLQNAPLNIGDIWSCRMVDSPPFRQ